jgi:DNA modification methylase
MTVEIITGDCRDVLQTMPDESIDCVVTSPPYFGLRDYGVDGQIGLEQTPDAYVAEMVAVFREVRRVLRDDGTLWLNLGDSYNNRTKVRTSSHQPALNDFADDNWAERAARGGVRMSNMPGIKEKDLIGIPWAVATALRNPYYTGKIARERDRVWLAAMIDGEGTICGFHHIRADDGRPRTGVHVTITNSSKALLDEAARIWPTSRSEHDVPGDGHLGKRVTWRWIVHGIENKTLILRELYPYLIQKKRQAMVAYNLLLLMAEAKRLGHSPQRDAIRDKRKVLTDLLSALNRCAPVDMPSWLIEPPSVFEPGWFLRQDIIWSKPNPMPESVRDRCTKAHEYLFLLSKSERYFFDADAIAEPATSDHASGNGFAGRQGGAEHLPMSGGAGSREEWKPGGKRNRRSVWAVATQPFKEAHFATFPPALIEPCILAGCPAGGTVLDPFGGAGTTGLVADRVGRNAILIELNPAYAEIAKKRLQDDAPLLAEVSA